MRRIAIRLLRFVARLAAFLTAVVLLYFGAVSAIGSWYALTTGQRGVIAGGALPQASVVAASVAVMIVGARLLVFATNARASKRRAKASGSVEDGAA